MMSWSQNSRSSLVRNSLAAGFLCLLAVAPTLSGNAFAAASPLSATLRSDLTTRRNNSFDALLLHWAKQHGATASLPLLELTRDTRLADADRYLALMGAARLGGQALAPQLVPTLKDRSWMLRSGTLRALSALKNPVTRDAVLPLLKDPSLVVRTEAVEAIRILRPEGAREALLQALESPANYHRGIAQWVPKRALQALAAIQAKDAAPRLLPLLNRAVDPALQATTIETLESLTGKKLGKTGPLKVRVEAWKRELSSVPAPVTASAKRSLQSLR
jgi:HEAT repeat protein